MSLYIGFLQATQAVKIPFKLEKTPVYQTRSFKLENVKTQVQIDRKIGAVDTTKGPPTFSDTFTLFQTQNVFFRNSIS